MFRWIALAVLVSAIDRSAYFRHRARKLSGMIPTKNEKPTFIVLRLPVLIMIRMVVIPAEEQALIETFGDDYRVFRERTGSLLPKL